MKNSEKIVGLFSVILKPLHVLNMRLFFKDMVSDRHCQESCKSKLLCVICPIKPTRQVELKKNWGSTEKCCFQKGSAETAAID